MKTIIPFIALVSFGFPMFGSSLRTAAEPDTTTVSAENIYAEETDSVPISVTLDDFVISQTKKLIESDGATLTYNVSEDPESKTNSTLEILRKIPGVTVDANDDIKVNGQSSFQIYINGREDPMMKGDIKTILKSMPASTIKKIEVLSDPGAKYSAEGSGGILNIVTHTKQALEGFLSNLYFSVTNQGIGATAYARTKIKNVTASASASYNNGRMFRQYSTYHSENENLESAVNRLQTTDSRSHNAWDYTEGNMNMSWEPDTLNLFTLGASIMSNTWGSPNDQSMAMFDINGNKQWSLRRTSATDGKWLGVSAQVSYQHTFRKQGHFIVASYSYDYSRNDNSQNIHTFDIVGKPSFEDDSPYSYNMSKSNNDGHIIQIDYTNPFNGKHKLEAGAKANLNSNRGNNAPWYGKEVDKLVIDEDNHVKPNQFKDILALYASYRGKFGKWSVRGGVRYEYTHMGIHYKLGDYQDFTTILNDVVPNLSTTFNFTSATNLRLAYNMRISRPGLGVLNPYRNTLTPGQVSYGNPDLKSEKSHNISLGYSNYAGKLSGSFKVKYYFSNNQVTDMIFIKDGLFNTTYANIGTYNDVAFEGNLNWNIIKDMNLSLWLMETYTHISVDSEMLKGTRVLWQTNMNLNMNYRFKFGMRVSAYGGYGSPWADLQSKSSSWYYYGLGLSRAFLKDDALSINLSFSNFITPYRTSTYTQIGESARYYSSNRNPQWGARMTISWKFGSLKSDVKQTSANIEKEAEAGSGSKGR